MKRLLTFWVITLLTFSFSMQVLAQQTITGTITEKGDTLNVAGATVAVVGTQVNTKTDDNGAFSIEVPAGAETLMFSKDGFKKLEVPVSGDSPLALEMELTLDGQINKGFTPISNAWQNIVLFKVAGIPFVVVLLVVGAGFFTLFFGFINVRRFPLAVNVVRGKYDELDDHSSQEPVAVNSTNGDLVDTIKNESEDGEVSHFQALATAVSGTVGLGNIAGVALAIGLGGPGATFWMIVCGLLGMSTKFVECTLGVKYRDVGEDGTVYGGPMYYLKKGFSEIGLSVPGQVLAVIFAVLCVGASFGGGNAAQSNQAASQLASLLQQLTGWESGSSGTIIGLGLAVIVGIVIIGGIKRIASVTEKIVPFMAVIYVGACLFIIISQYQYVGKAFGLIFTQAFNPVAAVGGLFGALIVGFQRAAFSNEAGAGSASIAHSAVKTKYPASEGLVALLEPFIDTVVICTMTALVIIIFNESGGVFEYGQDVVINGEKVEGSVLTSMAFESVIPWFPYVLTVAIILFAISTMISWSYYGSQAWMFLFGKSRAMDLTFKLIFCVFIVIGAAANMDAVWGFSDAMILALVFPNMIGLFFLFPKVREELNKYLQAIKGSKSK